MNTEYIVHTTKASTQHAVYQNHLENPSKYAPRGCSPWLPERFLCCEWFRVQKQPTYSSTEQAENASLLISKDSTAQHSCAAFLAHSVRQVPCCIRTVPCRLYMWCPVHVEGLVEPPQLMKVISSHRQNNPGSAHTKDRCRR